MIDPLVVALDAVIVAVANDTPRVLVRLPDALPAGPFGADERTLELALRRFVRDQTGLDLAHVEQLYTFGDRERDPRHSDGARIVSIAYLALLRETATASDAAWRSWYELFPWEDWREGKPAMIDETIVPALQGWVEVAHGDERTQRERRVRRCIGPIRGTWNAELALERYELFWETGLVAESRHPQEPTLGAPLAGDYRRIVATAISRIRGALRYRPLVFELLPEPFTLFRLQRTVEALGGVRVHKQNFRRVVAGAQLVEPTGEVERQEAGRPALTYRFRPEVTAERTMLGLSITPSR